MADSSLSVVESFYGQAVDQDLISKLAVTPPEQLHELALRVLRAQRQVELRLAAPFQVPGAWTKEGGAEEPFFLHDDTYFRSGVDYAVSDAPALKHLLIYCDKILVPDLFTDWAENWISPLEYYVDGVWSESSVIEAGDEAARALRQIAPLRELIIKEQVTLVGTPETFCPVPGLEEYGISRVPLKYLFGEFGREEPNGVSEVWRRDPYLAWLLIHKVRPVPKWELKAQGLTGIKDILSAAEYVLENLDNNGHFHGYGRGRPRDIRTEMDRAYRASGLSLDFLEQAAQYSKMTNDLNTSPVVSNDFIRRHLIRSTQVQMGDTPEPKGQEKSGPDLSVPIRYKVPSMSGVSLSDVISLRLNEDLYADVRTSLTELVEAVETLGHVGDYQEYQRTVTQIAEDTVRPTYERLNRQIRRTSWVGKIGGILTSAAIGLGFTGLAAVSQGALAPAVKAVGNPTSKAASRGVEKRLTRSQADRRTARSLLVSVLE